MSFFRARASGRAVIAVAFDLTTSDTSDRAVRNGREQRSVDCVPDAPAGHPQFAGCLCHPKDFFRVCHA